MNLRSCPDKSTLKAFAAGQLPGESSAEVSRHVDGCPACRAAVAEYNPSFLETLAPVSDNATECMVTKSPQSLRFIPHQNRESLSEESRGIVDGFAAALQSGADVDIALHLANHGIKSDSFDLSVEHVLLLLELLHVELQHAWANEAASSGGVDPVAAGSDHDSPVLPTTDQYVRRFPILRTCPLLVSDLAKREAVIRGFQVDDQRSNSPTDTSGIEQFDLIEPIASGGMGVVWRALNRELGRTVAVKLIQQNKVVGNPERQQLYQQRFLVEAQAAARLMHPNIVQIHSIHNTAGQLYYEMDLIEGGNLRDLIKGDATVPAPRAVELMRDIASAIDHAHRRGVIHRDLKPENILMQDGMIPMVTDFGLAKLVDSDTALTQDDTAMGTMSYMAPEQFRDAASVTVSADIYSLGSMLYELLAGEVPIAYKGDITSFSDKVENFDPLPPQRRDRSISKDIQNVCLKCLAKKPEQRYASAADLTDDLTAFLEGRPVSARRVGPLGHFWRICRRYPKTASLAGLLVMALLVGFLVSVKFMLDARQQAMLGLGAVNQFYLQIDQNDVFRQPAFNDLRVRLMKEGRDRLKELTYAPVSSRDKSNQRAIATLHFVNGRSLQASEQSAAAFAEFRLGESIQRGLSQDDPTDLDSQADLATTLVAMEQVSPQHEDVPIWLEEAQSLRQGVAERLRDDDPRKPKSLRLLANVFMDKANRLAKPIIQGHVQATPETVEEALRLFREASQKRNQAAALLPTHTIDQGEKDALDRDIMIGKANLAALLSQVKERTPDAVAAIQDAAAALSDYLRDHPWDVEARRQYAECQLSKYLMADTKADTEISAIEEAERDADIVVAMIPNDVFVRHTVARIALEQAAEEIAGALDITMESNAESFTPAEYYTVAIEQLSRAFEHLPAEPEVSGKSAVINDSEFLTAVRLARTLAILIPLEGPTAATDSAPDDLRRNYLSQLQNARQHLYQPPPDALQITLNDFHEARIQMLAYSAVVAHLKFQTSKLDAKARACLDAIASRRQRGHDSNAFVHCETMARQLLQSSPTNVQP